MDRELVKAVKDAKSVRDNDKFPKITECKYCGDACNACANECQNSHLINSSGSVAESSAS